MKNVLSDISQEEKNRILEMHKLATSKHYIKEQMFDDEQSKRVEYIKSKWGNDVEIDQNSAFIDVINRKTNSKIQFDIFGKKINYNKNFAIDPNPIPYNSSFDTFTKWFDKHNNYNPLSGLH